MKPARIDIWHNILWSQYKAEVFSSLDRLADKGEFDLRFFQMAETEGNRAVLSGVDTSRHRYAYTLLFKGSLDQIALPEKIKAVAQRTWHSDADLSLLTGYEKPECWLQMFLLKLKGRKVAIFCDSTLYDQPQKFLRGLVKKIIFKSVDGIFGYGERSRDFALYYGANPARWHRRRQAAALPHDYSAATALESRKRLAASVDAPRFVYIGRLSPEKALDTLLDAFASFRAAHTQAKLILVGNGLSREALEKQAAALGLGDSVEFTGGKSGPALFEEYAKATAFILPSTSEPWGLVVNEALSYGCPVIVSERCGCVPELVKNGATGFTHKAGNAKDLAAKMAQTVAQFADTEKTARACLDLIGEYTSDRAAQEMIEGCRKILGSDRI